MTSFAREIQNYIATEGLLSPGCKIIAGISGGADSTALLAVMTELGYHCIAINCNFGLRGEESERDSLFAKKTAETIGSEFIYKSFDAQKYADTKGISIEMACRELRYDYFEQIRKQYNIEAIAVGHHREDNIETFFLNLLRGSGIHGLRGILPKRGNIVRPLLNSTKTQIIDYLRQRGLNYVTDSSNSDNSFKRNRLRNIVIPLIESQFPGATDSISKSISLIRQNEDLYNQLLPKKLPESLHNISPTLLHELLHPYGFNSSQCKQISTADSGATFRSPTHILTIKPDSHYSLTPLSNKYEPPKLSHRIYGIESFKPEPGVLYIDKKQVNNNMKWELRTWQAGDRIIPFGMRGSRMVSDILAEAGIAASQRKNCYLLTMNDIVVWIVGIRSSNYFRITDSSTEIIEIRHEKF